MHSENAWRLLVAPKDATFEVRADAWARDAHLETGRSLAIPPLPTATAVNLLFVFEGKVKLGDLTIAGGEFYYLGDLAGTIEAMEVSDLVLFTTDAASPVFKGGMFSGNVLAA